MSTETPETHCCICGECTNLYHGTTFEGKEYCQKHFLKAIARTPGFAEAMIKYDGGIRAVLNKENKIVQNIIQHIYLITDGILIKMAMFAHGQIAIAYAQFPFKGAK